MGRHVENISPLDMVEGMHTSDQLGVGGDTVGLCFQGGDFLQSG